ncbi:MAG: bile acid:sodium symporter family protein [Bacteroidales bacterium]|nr:bile acid:sodium symporter family protein [Bacteroidales bacterium]
MSADFFSDILLPITLVIVTLGLGLSITLKDIKNIILKPKNIIIGFLSQMLILPIIAFAIALITKLDPEYAVGLVIIAMCPGGASANLVNYMLKTNVALSLSITVANGLFSTIKIPFFVMLTMLVFMDEKTRIHMPVGNAVLQIFILTIIPAALGIIIRRWKTAFAEKLEEPFRYILPILLIAVYAGIIFLEQDGSRRHVNSFLFLIPFTFALNLLSMLAGYYVPALFGLNKKNKVTIAVEVGLQNSALAIFVAGTLLNNYNMALVAVVYGSFSFFSSWLFGYVAKRYL